MTRSRLVFPALLLLLLSPLQSLAIPVYSNFGPDMTFDSDPDHGWGINGFFGPDVGQQAIAQQFTPGADFQFTDAKVAVVLLSGPDSINVYLQADSNGLPGAVIEKIPLSGLTSTPTILSANSELFPLLQSGTPYWLVLVAGADFVLAGWSWNSIGDASNVTFAGTQGGSPAGPWSIGQFATRSAFEIDGSPVIPVTIEIKPGSSPPAVINLAADGNVPIAILSSGSFDSGSVDPATVTVASAMVARRPNGTLMATLEDVNGDGLLDLVIHVPSSALSLSQSDTEAVLVGRTFGGQLIRGAESILVVP